MVTHRHQRGAPRPASARERSCHRFVPEAPGKRAEAVGSAEEEAVAASRTGPAAFGYKIAWLAIRTRDTGAVADALGVTRARAVSWAEGVEAAYSARQGSAVVFVTPPVDGWTLAVLGGGDLFEDDGTGSGVLDLAALSRRFGEAQKFATHRVVEYHEWQRWVGGLPVRRYCMDCVDIRFDEGDPARAEGNLPHAADLDTGNWEDFDLATESTVMAVAAEWSIDPTTLEERDGLPPEGVLGILP